jgi:hypothetical protein
MILPFEALHINPPQRIEHISTGDIWQTQPEVANAAQSNPARFAEPLRQPREAAFDVEAQRRIEEAIRHQTIMENLEHALEYSPESFGGCTLVSVSDCVARASN